MEQTGAHKGLFLPRGIATLTISNPDKQEERVINEKTEYVYLF